MRDGNDFKYALRPITLAVGSALLSQGLEAATITVNTLADGTDPVDCTLRDAIRSANADTAYGGCTAGSGPDTIEFSVTGSIILTAGSMSISNDVTIIGPGAGLLTVDGNDSDQIITTATGTSEVLDISGVTLTGAYGRSAVFTNNSDVAVSESIITGNHVSIGVVRSTGSLHIEDTLITDNHADYGMPFFQRTTGPVIEGGELTIVDSVISGNTCNRGCGFSSLIGEVSVSDTVIRDNIAYDATGGGYIGGGTFSITRTTIEGNYSGQFYGGLSIIGDGTISDSTITYNTALSNCGGVCILDGIVTIENTTISGNAANVMGGVGVTSSTAGPITLHSATITGNQATDMTDSLGGGMGIAEDVVISIAHSIISGNTAAIGPNDIFALDNSSYGGMVDISYSLVGDATGFTPNGTGNQFDLSAELMPLADNGGPTRTHLPLPSSPAIDAGDPTFTPPPDYDQRGPDYDRVIGPAIDMGAVEAGAGETIFDDGFESLFNR